MFVSLGKVYCKVLEKRKWLQKSKIRLTQIEVGQLDTLWKKHCQRHYGPRHWLLQPNQLSNNLSSIHATSLTSLIQWQSVETNPGWLILIGRFSFAYFVTLAHFSYSAYLAPLAHFRILHIFTFCIFAYSTHSKYSAYSAYFAYSPYSAYSAYSPYSAGFLFLKLFLP